jgi:hypothetical protein
MPIMLGWQVNCWAKLYSGKAMWLTKNSKSSYQSAQGFRQIDAITEPQV